MGGEPLGLEAACFRGLELDMSSMQPQHLPAIISCHIVRSFVVLLANDAHLPTHSGIHLYFPAGFELIEILRDGHRTLVRAVFLLG